MYIANQFSYVLFALGTLVVVLAVLRWRHVAWRSTLIAALVLALVFTGGFLAFRVGASDVASVGAAQAQIGNGKPTFLEFYSNFCAGCMAARPAVDELVTAMGDTFNVLRIDIHTAVGRELRAIYGFTYSPEFVLFAADGSELWRANSPPSAAELDQATTNTISSP